jgi:predicted RNA binding protein YcfA (HicA-like mRNA interferase family)
MVKFWEAPSRLRLHRIGWSTKRQSGSHRTLERPGWPDYVFDFHDGGEIGPRMLARIAKRTGLRPTDLTLQAKAAKDNMSLVKAP